MSQGRSIYLNIWKNFINSFKLKRYTGRTSRWYEPAKHIYPEPNIPPEWHAWLIHKRKLPPTEEEIQQNLLNMKKTLENARALEKPKPKANGLPEIKNFEKTPFPAYNDYEVEPGQKKN